MDEFSSVLPTPGQLIHQRLEKRGWSQRTLSVVLDVGESSITRLLSGKQQVDAELAVALEDVLDLPAEQLLHLQASHELASVRAARKEDSQRLARARLYGELPLREMIKRGWIAAADVRDTARIDTGLAELFGVTCPFGSLAAADGDVQPGALARRAWLARVRQLAAGVAAGSYTSERALAAIATLHRLRDGVGSIARVPSILADCGIRLVVVEALPGAGVEAACTWLDHAAPVIGLSLSEDRIDRFWFLLRHQLEHVLWHTNCVLPGEGDDLEAAPDAVAAEFCLPQSQLDDFLSRKAPFIARRDMIAFARDLDIHPGIVAGRIQQQTGKYESFGTLIAKVCGVLCGHAMMDGWGRRPETSFPAGP
jgi:HTH-type transcriptional regulator/antitoxin HigA